MYINNVTNNQPVFSGVKVNGVISCENTRDFGNFLSRFENIDFITNLEREFNTDMVLNSNLKTMTFEHKTYGNLANYGMKETETTNYLSNAAEIFRQIKNAILKAQKASDKDLKEKDIFKRGC